MLFLIISKLVRLKNIIIIEQTLSVNSIRVGDGNLIRKTQIIEKRSNTLMIACVKMNALGLHN